MSIRTPAEVFPPGDFIREELESRGWTQGNLAKITGRPVSAINLIISAKKAITPETACELAGAFGTSPEFWLNLESAYRLSMLESTNEAIRDRAKIFGASPVKEMEERNWIPRTESVDELRKELSKFYFLASSGEGLNLKVAARAKARTAEVLIPEQIAWCVQALRLATSVSVSTFKPQTLADGIRELRALATYPQEVKYVPRVLSQIGIRFVVVRHLTKTKIDGAALWLGDGWDSPVIALSMRHDRIDYFWHTLLHELSTSKIKTLGCSMMTSRELASLAILRSLQSRKGQTRKPQTCSSQNKRWIVSLPVLGLSTASKESSNLPIYTRYTRESWQGNCSTGEKHFGRLTGRC